MFIISIPMIPGMPPNAATPRLAALTQSVTPVNAPVRFTTARAKIPCTAELKRLRTGFPDRTMKPMMTKPPVTKTATAATAPIPPVLPPCFLWPGPACR